MTVQSVKCKTCARFLLDFSRQFTLLLAKEKVSVLSGKYHLVIFPLQDYHCEITVSSLLSRSRSSISFIRNVDLFVVTDLIAYQEKTLRLFSIIF